MEFIGGRVTHAVIYYDILGMNIEIANITIGITGVIINLNLSKSPK
ncbi:hypothetical protein MNBD_GAMMA07-1280 [hydrothermal vent metagenome]|uniref:Uncharacterized protein n=1 Tax=hydrothermal vent metagenome TaxID=652676 RepID=A0A3B0WK73_9ZZZZ